LDFWYDYAGPQKWYAKSDAFDSEIRRRFEPFCAQAAADVKTTGSHEWQKAPDSVLALIIALDQFPRNMYRDTKAAFAYDSFALRVATLAIKDRLDLNIDVKRRAFFYMPFMHAEDIDMQDKCVALIDMRLNNENSLFHAKKHREVIARFGRFPHRNNVLGRESTTEEDEYLLGGGYAP
jgi:uncharacterized protein (DUF924 family)